MWKKNSIHVKKIYFCHFFSERKSYWEKAETGSSNGHIVSNIVSAPHIQGCTLTRVHWHDKSGNESIGRYERKGRRVRGESLLRPPDKGNFTKVLGDRRKCEHDKIKIRPRVFYFHFDFSRHRDSSPCVVCVDPNNRSRQFMQLL